mmetsp:Transcript_3535/g.10666  ORF Transcript_3535/g.10666 Transcript_3535/m.10666 type:complete len:249 (-) Transcript_3535:13-759(-)
MGPVVELVVPARGGGKQLHRRTHRHRECEGRSACVAVEGERYAVRHALQGDVRREQVDLSRCDAALASIDDGQLQFVPEAVEVVSCHHLPRIGSCNNLKIVIVALIVVFVRAVQDVVLPSKCRRGHGRSTRERGTTPKLYTISHRYRVALGRFQDLDADFITRVEGRESECVRPSHRVAGQVRRSSVLPVHRHYVLSRVRQRCAEAELPRSFAVRYVLRGKWASRWCTAGCPVDCERRRHRCGSPRLP